MIKEIRVARIGTLNFQNVDIDGTAFAQNAQNPFHASMTLAPPTSVIVTVDAAAEAAAEGTAELVLPSLLLPFFPLPSPLFFPLPACLPAPLEVSPTWPLLFWRSANDFLAASEPCSPTWWFLHFSPYLQYPAACNAPRNLRLDRLATMSQPFRSLCYCSPPVAGKATWWGGEPRDPLTTFS